MPKRSPRIKLFEWRVIKIRSTPATLIGYFTAANADDAIKRAIVERKISDPLAQSRLAGQKVARDHGTTASVPEGRAEIPFEGP